jgi:hypothetical protein
MHYAIQIKGHVDGPWLECFEDAQTLRSDDGSTLLYGFMPDQSAFIGALNRLNDLSMTVMSVQASIQPLRKG